MRCELNTLEFARDIVRCLEEKKGEDILLLDIQTISSFTDYFILCSASSSRMLDALADEVIKTAKVADGSCARLEGVPSDGWLVIDIGDVVVHLFIPEQREYYKLEQLWSKGKIVLHLQ